MAKSTTVIPEKARRNADPVLALWRDGRASAEHLRKLQGSDPAALRYRNKEGTYEAEARRLGKDVDTATKLRRYAQEYSYRQVQELRGLITRHRSRFGPSHLLVLLRVGDRARRDALTHQAVREGWTRTRLARAVQAVRGGRRGHVGRKPDVPADPAERRRARDTLAEKWTRWCNEARPDLPESLRPLVFAATTAVAAVQQGAVAQFRSPVARGRSKKRK